MSDFATKLRGIWASAPYGQQAAVQAGVEAAAACAAEIEAAGCICSLGPPSVGGWRKQRMRGRAYRWVLVDHANHCPKTLAARLRGLA